MCLNTLTKTFDLPSKKIRRAWKIVEQDQKELFTPFQNFPLTRKKWLVSKRNEPLTTENWHEEFYRKREYPSGFHCFVTKREALKSLSLLTRREGRKVVLVEIKEIVAIGEDGTSDSFSYINAHLRCYVARKMRLL